MSDPPKHADLARKAPPGKGAPDRLKRRGKMRHAGALVEKLTKRAIGRRGFAQASILTDWARIVGPELARHAQPDKMVFPKGKRVGGSLRVRAPGPMALQLQHLTPLVISRINAHFGYNAVETVTIVQGALTPPAPTKGRRPRRALSPGETAELEALVAASEPDDALAAALRRLGGAVIGERAEPTSDPS